MATTTTDVSPLKINYLTQSQYNTALTNNQINANELYLTPADDTVNISIATNAVAGIVKPWYYHSVASSGPTAGSNATAVTVNGITTDAGKYYAVEIDKDGRMFVNVPWADNDTKNTAGSTDTSSKIYLIGATEQGANPQTYSHDTAYVGTDGCLYSDGSKVLTAHQTYTSFTGKPTGNQSPGFGSTFTIQQISQATSGQVSGTDRTVTIPDTIATNTAVGLVKPWYTHTAASTGPTTGNNATAVTVNAITTTSGKYYAVEADSNGRLFVNVPWTNVNSNYLTSSSTLNADNLSGTIPATSLNSHLYINTTSGGSNSNTSTSNNSTYIHLYDDTLYRDTIQLLGTGSTTITASNSKVITINSTNNYVAQGLSSTTSWRKILGSYNYTTNSNDTLNTTNMPNVVYYHTDVAMQPSTGTIRANIYRVQDNVELQWNSTDESLDFVFI